MQQLPIQIGLSRLATKKWLRPWAKGLALVAFVWYVGWNAWWLGHGRVPPSVFFWATGWPCPTTGGTRSLQAWLAGDVGRACHMHPLSLPLLGMFVFSVCWPVGRLLMNKSPNLPKWAGWAWAVLLLAAWVCKWVMGPSSW